MNEQFVRNRITELRLKKDVSEYQMSLDLGKNKSYIQGISSGRSMPSMKQFFEICDYLEITPLEFFDTEMAEPPQFRRAVELLKELDNEDWEAIIPLLMRLRKEITQKQAEPCLLYTSFRAAAAVSL